MPEKADEDAERRRWGLALQRLRERARKKQAEAAEAADLTRQGWGLYENGKMAGIFRPETQDRLARAVDATREELQFEFERLAIHPDSDIGLSVREPDSPPYEVPLVARVRVDETHRLSYDLRRADAKLDLAWLFSPDAGFIRMAGSHLHGLIENGEVLIFDRSRWPSRGDACVIELSNAMTYVYAFDRQDGGALHVRQLEPLAEVEFNMAAVKGVYGVRLVGD